MAAIDFYTRLEKRLWPLISIIEILKRFCIIIVGEGYQYVFDSMPQPIKPTQRFKLILGLRRAFWVPKR